MSTLASSSSSALSDAPPSPAAILFARGVLARLAVWPALTLAIAQGWGSVPSAQKRPWLAGVLVDAFTDPDDGQVPDAEYVEAMLLQIMQDEFDCNLEDESAWDVAKDVVRCWEAIAKGGKDGEEVVSALEKRAEGVKGKKVQAQEVPGQEEDWDEDEDESGSDDGMDVDEVPQLLDSAAPREKNEPIVDDDGFTLVPVKGKARK
jgi:pre-rRNA-processing protein TSR2